MTEADDLSQAVTHSMLETPHYYLGAPMFANSAWKGALFTNKAKSSELLGQYAQVFNTVEGNSTFYGIPSAQTVETWRSAVPSSFRFCFKLPRAISHESTLNSPVAYNLRDEFLRRLEPLRDRVGQLLLQLSPSFDGRRFDELQQFVADLPAAWQFAVEPRHLDFFSGQCETDFVDLLNQHGVSRGLFDTSVLQNATSIQPSVVEAQRKKPRVPRRTNVTSTVPFIRFVGHDDLLATRSGLEWLAETVATWIRAGLTPYVFIHTPDDRHVPKFCRAFHQLLQQHVAQLPAMAEWPAERDLQPKQGLLFD